MLPGSSTREKSSGKVVQVTHLTGNSNSSPMALVNSSTCTPRTDVIGPQMPVGANIAISPSPEHGCQPPPPGTGVSDVETLHKLGFLVPASKQQLVVDRMARYVVKNGNDFETVVKEKKESRFDFVLSLHKYHDYYEYRKACYEKVEFQFILLKV